MLQPEAHPQDGAAVQHLVRHPQRPSAIVVDGLKFVDEQHQRVPAPKSFALGANVPSRPDGCLPARHGLTICAELNENEFPGESRGGGDEQMTALSLFRDDFHCDWNYTISPSRKAH